MNSKCRRFLQAASFALSALCLPQLASPAPRGKPAADQPGGPHTTAPKGKLVIASSSFVLDIPNTRMAFAVYLNGWLIDHNPGGKVGYFSSNRLGSAVADGENTVTLYVDRPNGVPPPADRCEVRVRSEAGEVYHYDWEPGDPKRPLPFEATGHFTAHLPHGPYTWQRGAAVKLDGPTKESLNAFLRRVYGALSARNLGESEALFSAQVRDQYLARGQSQSEADAENRAEWEKAFSDPHWRVDPIDFAGLKYTVIAEGRVVEVRRADEGLVFREAAPPHDGYDVLFCLVGGKWTIINPSGQ